MNRPDIKDFFPDGTTWQYIHKVYKKCLNLYNYAGALDIYIDHLEEGIKKENSVIDGIIIAEQSEATECDHMLRLDYHTPEYTIWKCMKCGHPVKHSV